MLQRDITFTESLDYRYLSLSKSGHLGISTHELIELADFETSNLLNQDYAYQDPLGFSILRSEIQTKFSYKNDEAVFIRNNYLDVLELFGKEIIELKLPLTTESKNDIYDEINNYNSDNYFYFIDKYGLDYSKITNNKIIYISSAKYLFGANINSIVWFSTKCSKLSKFIESKLLHNGVSTSFYDEILTLIAIRNSSYINKLNNQQYQQNLAYISEFIEENKDINIKLNMLDKYSLLHINNVKSSDIISQAKSIKGFLIREHEEQIVIHYGSKKFISEFSIFKKFLKNYLENSK